MLNSLVVSKINILQHRFSLYLKLKTILLKQINCYTKYTVSNLPIDSEL